MIGIYDYTVLLTYLSLLSAGTGIMVSLSGIGHPYWGSLFLLICGLCDAFDGKVARTKKERSTLECNFGIQIDSLSDLVAFGVLPACIGATLIQKSPMLDELFGRHTWYSALGKYALFAILVLYPLAAMIRLAYFNVTEEERQKTEGGVRKYYVGLPVTSASLIFPAIAYLHYVLDKAFKIDITLIYVGVALLTGFLFLAKIQVRKPGLRGILTMVAVGVVEFLIYLLFRLAMEH